jgi:hypothetical protein
MQLYENLPAGFVLRDARGAFVRVLEMAGPHAYYEYIHERTGARLTTFSGELSVEHWHPAHVEDAGSAPKTTTLADVSDRELIDRLEVVSDSLAAALRRELGRRGYPANAGLGDLKRRESQYSAPLTRDELALLWVLVSDAAREAGETMLSPALEALRLKLWRKTSLADREQATRAVHAAGL